MINGCCLMNLCIPGTKPCGIMLAIHGYTWTSKFFSTLASALVPIGDYSLVPGLHMQASVSYGNNMMYSLPTLLDTCAGFSVWSFDNQGHGLSDGYCGHR
jgi:hypothetical protein